VAQPGPAVGSHDDQIRGQRRRPLENRLRDVAPVVDYRVRAGQPCFLRHELPERVAQVGTVACAEGRRLKLFPAEEGAGTHVRGGVLMHMDHRQPRAGPLRARRRLSQRTAGAVREINRADYAPQLDTHDRRLPAASRGSKPSQASQTEITCCHLSIAFRLPAFALCATARSRRSLGGGGKPEATSGLSRIQAAVASAFRRK
jgi:hypothetical protein